MPGPRLWAVLWSQLAACWHRQLLVRSVLIMLIPQALCWHREPYVDTASSRWGLTRTDSENTGQVPAPDTDPAKVTLPCVGLSGLSFYVTTARRCVQDSGSTTSAAKYAQLATPWVRNQKLKTLPLRASTHRHPPTLHPTTFYPYTLTHVLGNLSLNIFIRTSKNCTLSFNLDRTTHSPSNNGQSTLEVHIY